MEFEIHFNGNLVSFKYYNSKGEENIERFEENQEMKRKKVKSERRKLGPLYSVDST